MMMRFALCLVICTLSLLIAPSLSAVPVIDGRFDPSEGYTSGFVLDFDVEGGGTASGGELWLFQDVATNDLSVAFIQPLTLVDNSYGANGIGWGSSAPGGYDDEDGEDGDSKKEGGKKGGGKKGGGGKSGGNHKFDHLLNSDKAQIVLTDGAGNTVLDVTLDYLHGFGTTNGKPDKKLPPYRSGGVTDGDGSVSFGSASDVLDVASSLEYNFDMFGTTHPELFGIGSSSPAADNNYNVTDPSLTAWIFDVIYEFKIDGSVFGTDGFGSLLIPVVHDSPNKINKNMVFPRFGPPIPPESQTAVPEPATLLLLGGGLAGLYRFRKRRLHKKA